jgi:outer membrane protein
MQEDPSIKQAFYQSQISLGQYRATNSSFLPTLTLSYYNSTQQYDNKYEPFQGGPKWFPATYWNLKASWNIFSSGGKIFQSKRNKIAYNETLLQLEDTKRQSAINDENLRLSYEKSKALLQKTEDVMKLSFDNYSHISYRYEAGIQSLEDRLNAFSDYINYQNQYLNGLSDMLLQLYQLKIRQQSF